MIAIARYICILCRRGEHGGCCRTGCDCNYPVNDRDLGTTGRIFVTEATGANAEELENDALMKAQAFFGPGVSLDIKPDYITMQQGDGYYARVVVRVR